MYQSCPICAWINPEDDFDAGPEQIDPATKRLLRHLMDVHYEPGAAHQPWEDRVFTTVRIDEP